VSLADLIISVIERSLTSVTGRLDNISYRKDLLLKISVLVYLLTETHLAERLTFARWQTPKVKQSITYIAVKHKLIESKKNAQLIVFKDTNDK
jgi:uncharacterized membrane protein SirB2